MTSTRHLANIITMTRILGVGLIFWFTPYTNNFWQHVVAHIFIFVCITDFLDGWIARKLKIVSDLGKVLDPLADKILVLVFLPLLEMQVITSFPVFIILAREFAVMALRVVSVKEGGSVIPAQFAGKLKTAFTLPVCGILLGRVAVTEVPNLPVIFMPLELVRRWVMIWPEWVITVLIYATVLVTIWSFLEYFDTFIWQHYVKKKWQGDEKMAKKAILSIVPNAFSVFNLFCGFCAVVTAWVGLYHVAVLLVILGIILDGLDGTIARKLDAESKFGATLDSKADFISFGIAPAVVIFKLLSTNPSAWWFRGSILIALIYYFSVHYRLRRFDRTGHSDHFEGLPSPVGALLIVLAAISQYLSQPYIFCGIIIVVSLLMVSNLLYPHHNIARRKRFFRFLQLPGAIFLILTILKLLELPYARDLYAYEIFFFLTCLYVLSPLGQVFRKR